MRRWAGVLCVLAAVVVAVIVALRGALGGGPAAHRTPAGRAAPAGGTIAGQPRGSPAKETSGPAHPVTLTAVGDTELGHTPQLPADVSNYLVPVQSALAAPIVFGNLEGTLTDATGSKCGAGSSNCYAFRTPPSFADALRHAGFTVLNSANNHSHDFGTQGVADTTAALQKAGLAQAGLPGQVAVVKDGNTKVAFVDFAPYPNVNDLLDPATAKDLIQQARRQADIVVAYMHAGAEGSTADHVTGQSETYVGEDRGNAKAFAHAAIDDGASLVLASGPHVLRGMEFYSGHLIAYSLGDFAGYQNFSTSGNLDLSAVLRVTLDGRGGWVHGSLVSLVLDSAGKPSVDSGGAAGRFINQLSASDFGTSAAAVNAGGDIVSPKPPGATSSSQ